MHGHQDGRDNLGPKDRDDRRSNVAEPYADFDPNVAAALTALGQARLEAEAGFLIDLTLGALSDVDLAGAVFHWLGSRAVFEQLSIWSEDEPLLVPVVRVAGALAAAPQCLAGLPKPNPAFQVAAGFRGKLDFYLASLLAARQPARDARERDRCERFRCLIFAQAVRQALRGNFNDRHLREVARATRNAFDDGRYKVVLAWIAGLHSEAVSLDTFCFDIEAAARNAPDSPKNLGARIGAVARGDASPLPMPTGRRWGPADLAIAQRLHPDLALPVFGEDADGRLAGRGPVIRTREEADRSPPQLRSAASGVLLARAEELNYLPFSWANPRPDEVDTLALAVDRWLDAPDLQGPLLGALACVAGLTGNSMGTVGAIAISDDPTDYWALSRDGTTLHRRPSRAPLKDALSDAAAVWLAPPALQWRIALPARVVKVLARALQRHPAARGLHDLWHAGTVRPLDQAFVEALHTLALDPAHRLGSARLGNILTTRTFAHTEDAVLTRLIAARPKSAFPGACTYPAWKAESVGRALRAALPASFFSSIHTGAAGENAAGSRLDVIDHRLIATLASLRQRYRALDPAQWIERHNLLTGYCVIALLAATGARPVDSPFESPAHFNWGRGWLYLNDKAQDAVHRHDATGRVVPLPAAALDLVVTTYLPHLSTLERALRDTQPAFARHVAALARREPTDRLPFFFFLDDREGVDWMAVRESSLAALTGIDWPLPWNLFRHRLATRLRDSGCDPEVIDALLGHSEAGAESYGEYAWRVPLSDFGEAAAHLASAYARLGIEALPVAPLDAAAVPRVDGTDDLPARPFGITLRRLRREQDQAHARERARQEVASHLAGRELSALSADEMNELEQGLAMTLEGAPHPHRHLRCQMLEAMIAASWEKGQRVRRTHRHLPVTAGRLFHTPEAVDAIERLQALTSLYRRLRPLKNPKAPTAALLAAIDLCLRSRVSDLRMLEAVRARKDHRLVKLDGIHWIEYQEGLREHPRQPVARIPISRSAAEWTQTALSFGARGCRSLEVLPEGLAELATAVGLEARAAPAALLKALARLVAAANSVELPRALAAWLDGRLASWGWLRADWVRFRNRVARRSPLAEEPLVDPPTAPAEAAVRVTRLRRTSSQAFELRIEVTRQLIDEIRDALRAWEQRVSASPSEGADGEAGAGTSEPRAPDAPDPGARRTAQRRLQALVHDAPADAPPAVTALAEWVLDLLCGKLVASSVQRYFSALAPRFRDFLHSEDLADLDADDLTDLYSQMVEARYDDAAAQGGAARGAAGGSARRTATAKDETINEAYVAARLHDFHAFARVRFGLDDPDWSEIAESGPAAAGSPGFVREAEYLHALKSLVGPLQRADRLRLCHGMLLLLAFRFGLRGKEGHGLQRRDWLDLHDTVVVLVRGNASRRLKTPAGRRQVPQLFTFSPYEQGLVRRVLATWSALTNDDTLPLLAMDATGAVPLLRQVRRTIITALRAATRNPLTNLHHARHAFASELAWALVAPAGTLPRTRHDRWIVRDLARDRLLGTRRTTRRAAWALARAMGHASPVTTLRSYVHWFPDLLAAFLPNLLQRDAADPGLVDPIDDCDAWPLDPDYLPSGPIDGVEVVAPRPPDAEQIVTALRMLEARKQREAIAEAIGASADIVGAIEEALGRANFQLTRPTRRPRPSRVRTPSRRRAARGTDADAPWRGLSNLPDLLAHIGPARWDVLAGYARGLGRSTALPREFNWEAALRLIRPTVQLVLWDEAHFQWIATFLDAMELRDEIAVYETDNLDPHTAAWADRAGLHERRAQYDARGHRDFQVDGVRDGIPEVSIRHRCAVVPKHGSRFASRFELLALWVAFALHCRWAR